MDDFRLETDSLGEVRVPADRLWGAQTQRALANFAIGDDLIPREMIGAYAVLKKAAALANQTLGQLSDQQRDLIVEACDEILAGHHSGMFPLNVWMSGSGTPFNMNVNEVISNRCCQLAGMPLGAKRPVHPNDHVNLSQSTNDTFPTAMHIAVAVGVTGSLLPALSELRDQFAAKAEAWDGIVKIGRTHLQDAVPLTLGQEVSGWVGMLDEAAERLTDALKGIYRLTLGGTAVGTGLNALPGFAARATAEVAALTALPFVPAENRFALQGAHDALVGLSGALRTLAVSLYKIANDIRLLSCGPRCGLQELRLPPNEPGSSIMPGKVNPTQCEALAMLAVQVMANDVAVGFGGAGGSLQMNAYKPLMIRNLCQSIRILSDGCRTFGHYLVEGMQPNEPQIALFVERSLMLVTALVPLIGYDRAAQVAHHAASHDLTLREAALQLGVVSAATFDAAVDPAAMARPNPGKPA